MREVPQFSTFANRRGKTRKSTARMARQVITNIPPRYVVRKGRTGKALKPSRAVFKPPAVPFDVFEASRRAFVLGGIRFRPPPRHTIRAGAMRRIFRRRGAEEYKVMAESMAPTFRRKSSTVLSNRLLRMYLPRPPTLRHWPLGYYPPTSWTRSFPSDLCSFASYQLARSVIRLTGNVLVGFNQDHSPGIKAGMSILNSLVPCPALKGLSKASRIHHLFTPHIRAAMVHPNS